MICLLSKRTIDEHNETIREFISRALVYNGDEITLDDIMDGAEKGDYSLWGGIVDNEIQSVIVLNMLYFPQKKVLNIMIVVSDDMSILKEEFLLKMNAFAKLNDCDSIYLHGRDGWRKVLEPFGYEKLYEVLERKL